MSKKSSLHYYDDGDIIIVIKDVSICAHKKYLSMASKIFFDMCSCATVTNGELPVIHLDEESETTFEELLSFLYPSKYVRITWTNVEPFLHLADKYEITIVSEAAEDFLEHHFQDNPLKSLVMSDLYEFKKVYKESSKLVLNKLPEYRKFGEFRKLSLTTVTALLSRYLDYVSAVGSLKKFKPLEGYNHDILCVTHVHINVIENTFEERIRQAQVYPTPAPSKIFKLFSGSISSGLKSCDGSFEKMYLPTKLKAHFGQFEPLENEKRKPGASCYLFIVWSNIIP